MCERLRFLYALATIPYYFIAEIRMSRKFRHWEARYEAAKPWTDGTY